MKTLPTKLTLFGLLPFHLSLLGPALAEKPPKVAAINSDSPFANCLEDDPAGQQGTVSNNSEVEPWVAVNPNDKKHMVTCRPSRNGNCLDAQEWREIRLTPNSFDIGQAPFAGGLFLGDYNGLAAAKNHFVSVFSVSSLTDPANLLSTLFKNGDSGKTDKEKKK